jgi:hypothetical protein
MIKEYAGLIVCRNEVRGKPGRSTPMKGRAAALSCSLISLVARLCLKRGEILHQHAVNEDVTSAHFAQEEALGGRSGAFGT